MRFWRLLGACGSLGQMGSVSSHVAFFSGAWWLQMFCFSQVRFHDDKTTYTGTHARGGPEAVPKASLQHEGV